MKRRKICVFVFWALFKWGLCLPTVPEIDIWADSVNDVTNTSFKSDSNFTDENNRQAKVLNFFPIPVEEECRANDGRRTGICMNTYECRMQSGTSFGACALGFGVCCVFKATCSQDIYNNITYFVNPDFPDLSHGVTTCTLKVKKIDPDIAQLRLDFIHFNLGQPNRKNGVCEEDSFILAGGALKPLTLCGINSGQHVYYDIETMNEAISITVNLTNRAIARLWEIRIMQIPFTQRAPVGCLQYHTGMKGVIQTMNFADNGRHLANQDYNICMRQEDEMCSIAYEPCDDNSFKIGPNSEMGNQLLNNPMNTNINSINGLNTGVPGATGDQAGAETGGAPGLGGEDVDMADLQDVGSGDDGLALDVPDIQSRMMEICTDRIVLPCDSEEFIMPGMSGGFCDLARCGSSLCPNGETPCRVESSTTPFKIGVHFGASAREESPEDNLGMCLRYEQLPCSV